MTIFTSRYSNPELRKGIYTTVRISLGTPKWEVGYKLSGEMKDLMPFGLLNKYELYDDFKREYFQRLDRVGARRIQSQLDSFSRRGQDIVLLCYEDIRKGPENWCHRTAFAEWWKLRTGEPIGELFDPTPNPNKAATSPVKVVSEQQPIIPPAEQLSLF